MADSRPRYETKTIHTVRGLESRTLAKMRQDGWELVEQTEAPMLRYKLTFRRERKPVPRWAWGVGGAAAAVVVIAVVAGSIGESHQAPGPTSASGAVARTTASATTATTALPSPSSVPHTSASAATPVTDAEVLAVFNDFFQERASTGVVLGEAVTDVAYEDRVVTVTFSPAAAGVTPEAFDSGNPFPNLGKFAATPIAFSDEIGNRIRPAVDTIVTIRDDGAPLGTYTHAEILALNELSE